MGKQEWVNEKAEYVGASSGTAKYDGVPGANYGYENRYGYNDGDRYVIGYKSYGYDNKGYDNDYNRGYDNDYNRGYGYEKREEYGSDKKRGYGYEKREEY